MDDFIPEDDFVPEDQHENFLMKAIQSQGGKRYSPFESFVSSSVGGPVAAGMGTTYAEDVAPAATQFVSDIGLDASGLGFIPGVKPAITTGLTTLAEGGRQGIKALRGEGFDSGQLGKTAAGTMAGELMGRGVNKLFMGNAANRVAAKEGMNKLAKMKEMIRIAGDKNPNLGIPKKYILSNLEDLYAKSINPKGPAKQIFEDWIGILGDKNLTHVTPRMLLQMEEQFGQAAKFFPEGSNFMEKILSKIANPIKDTVLNTSSKAARTMASKGVEGVAEDAGILGFKQASKKFSEAKYGLQGQGTNWLQKAIGGIGEIGGGAVLGHQFGNHPIEGALLGIADLIRRNPVVQDFLYKTISRSGLGTAGTVASSDFLRNTK